MNTPKPRGDVAKLPRWARDHIEVLERAHRDAETAVELARGARAAELGDVNIVADPYGRALPVGGTLSTGVAFLLDGQADAGAGAGRWIRGHVTDRGGELAVELSASYALRIEPGASNVIRVTVER